MWLSPPARNTIISCAPILTTPCRYPLVFRSSYHPLLWRISRPFFVLQVFCHTLHFGHFWVVFALPFSGQPCLTRSFEFQFLTSSVLVLFLVAYHLLFVTCYTRGGIMHPQPQLWIYGYIFGIPLTYIFCCIFWALVIWCVFVPLIFISPSCPESVRGWKPRVMMFHSHDNEKHPGNFVLVFPFFFGCWD